LHLLISRHYLFLAADFSLSQSFTIGFGGGIVKLTDFGLWFGYLIDEDDNLGWSTTIPREGYFEMFYDGVNLATQWGDFDLEVYGDDPYMIKFKNNFTRSMEGFHRIGRRLTLDDFEIIPNPDYRGDL
jgi:hypothetical protein